MPANNASFTIMLTTEGGGQVKASLNDIAAALRKNSKDIGDVYDQTATAAERAAEREALAAKRAEEAEQRRMAATARRVADSLDPTAPAQRTFDAESMRVTAATKAGLLTQEQHAAYLAKLRNELFATTGAMKEHGSVLGLNRMQYITAQSAVLRFTDSVIAGRNPLTALSLESHKVVEIMSMSESGMGGALAAVAAVFTPVVIGATALTAALVAGIAAAYQYSAQMDALEAAATGFGRTSQLTGAQLMQIAQDGARAGDVSVSTAEKIEAAILHQTRVSADSLGDAVAITQKFADAMGIDATKAAEMLGKAMAEPAKGADDLATKYGYLTAAQIEEIHQLIEANRLTDAQSLLMKDLGGALDKAGDHVTAFTKLMRDLTSAATDSISKVGEAIAHMAGYFSKADQAKDLADKIAAAQKTLDNPAHVQWFQSDDETRRQIATWKSQLADLGKADTTARPNALAGEARDIVSKYGLNRDVQPKLEQLKQELATLQDAQRAGQHVDADTVDALNHAIRTFMTPEQKRVAEQTARALLRQAAPHSADRERAGQLTRERRGAAATVEGTVGTRRTTAGAATHAGRARAPG